MNARWDVAGKGEWRDKLIELTALSTGFDQLKYGAMEVSKPRLVLDNPVRWYRDPDKPTFSGALSLNAGQTRFSGGSRIAAVGADLQRRRNRPDTVPVQGRSAC